MLLLRGWLLGVALASVSLSVLYLTRWSSGLNTGLAFRPVSDVAGGLVIGTPEQVWTKSCSGCGQIYYTFQTTTATGTATFTITVTQGSPVKTLFHYSFTGSVAKNSIEVISVGNVSFAGAVAGAATINVATTIGTATIKGAAKIVLH